MSLTRKKIALIRSFLSLGHYSNYIWGIFGNLKLSFVKYVEYLLLQHERWDQMNVTLVIKSNLVFICIALQFVGLLGTPAQGQNPRFDVGSNLIVVGDSFTNGSTEWSRRVNQGPEFSIDTFSDGGRRINQIDELFGDQYQPDTYDAVVIAAGVNDVIANRSAIDIQSSLESIIEQTNGEQIILTSIAPFRGLPDSWTQARQTVADAVDAWVFAAAAASDRISVFDIRAILDTDNNQVIDAAVSSGDGLHPSICPFGDECGSEVIADAFVSQFSVAAVPELGCTTALFSMGILLLGRRRR